MHITAVIPARFSSTRLPGKPLHLIAGKSLIQRVYEAVFATNLFNKVIIATDHSDIYSHAKSINAEVVMTSINHQSGTDRVEECVRNIETDLIINIQGDEPFITKEPLKSLISVFNNKNVNVASMMHILLKDSDIQNSNNVKVVVDSFSNALYFSRSAIPFFRNDDIQIIRIDYFKHIGIYAFRPEMLRKFVALPVSKLEKIEKLEQLRLLENGYKIKMVLTDYTGIGIDTPEDIEKAEQLLKYKF